MKKRLKIFAVLQFEDVPGEIINIESVKEKMKTEFGSSLKSCSVTANERKKKGETKSAITTVATSSLSPADSSSL